MKSLSLEVTCAPDNFAPDERRCIIDFSFEPPHEGFIDCSLGIRLPPQLDLNLSGFLFYERDFRRLQEAIDSGTGLETAVIDSDQLLKIRAELRPDWVVWSLDWQGLYLMFPPFDPDAPPNASLLIRDLRARHIDRLDLLGSSASSKSTETETGAGSEGH